MNSVDKIFKDRLIQNHLSKFGKEDIPDFDKKYRVISLWRKACITGDLNHTKETQIQGNYLIQIIDQVLGYSTVTSTETNMFYQKAESKSILDTSEADGGLGFFSENPKIDDIRVVIELKDAKTPLDKKQNRSSHLTPIEQAFSYANKNGSKCGWVIVSNFVETRLYKSNSSLEYEVFDLRKMDNEVEFIRFYFMLCKDHLICENGKSLVDNLYQENEEMGIAISNDFYKTYKEIRNNLYTDLKTLNTECDSIMLFTKTQKIMDRFTFVCFCEDSGLLPQNLYKGLVDSVHKSFSFAPNKLWNELKGLFMSIDQGNPPMKVNKYNGGLFKTDPELDALAVSDEVLESFLKLSGYDFGSDLNVNILGQIFEQSIADVEQIKKEINGEASTGKGKQKDDGIFYTPYYVTRYIVEQTVGVLLKNKKEELKRSIFKNGAFETEVYRKSTGRKNTLSISSWTEIPEEKANVSEDEAMRRQAVMNMHYHYWSLYEDVLRNIKICDPACGSGAFLNQCFDYLHEEMDFVHEMKFEYDGQRSLFDIDKEILQNNLYGVDINPESVEITKLSLWLKTAKQNQTLASLDNNIKCGNSLISDTTVVSNAFIWQEAFPDVFSQGGFDVIIGNPPYGATLDQKQKDYLTSNYNTTEYNFDTYKTFFELGFRILKDGGYLGYITPNTFFTLELGANKLRRFLFDNNTLCRIVEVYNVFPDAIVEPVITVFKKKPPINEEFTSICIPRKIRLTSTFLNEGIEASFIQSDIKRDIHYIFNYRSSKEDQAVCDEMKKAARLDTMFDVMTGAKPYQVGKGMPPQTREIVSNKPFTGFEKIDNLWLPYMRGRIIDRYTNKWKETKEYIKYGEWLAEPRSPEVFKGKKLFIRQTGDSLIATYDEGNVSNNTLHSIYPLEDTGISLYYLLGIINSRLLNWYYQIVNYLEIGKPMAEVKGIYIKKLPIAIGDDVQIKSVEGLVKKLLDICQRQFDIKNSFIHYITKTYEPKKITERLADFEGLSFKEFIDELKKVKVKLTATQQKDLLVLYEDTVNEMVEMENQINSLKNSLDYVVFDIYNTPDSVIQKIMN